MKRMLIGLNLIILVILPIHARADAPLDTVKETINRLLDVLRDPALQGESAAETKKEKIRSLANELFDYTDLSERTLSRYWEQFKPEQRKEFIELYKGLLEKVYMNKILQYSEEKVVFGRERKLTEDRVEVESKIVSGSKETPVNFRMVLKNGQWRVYDIVIEGISLITNYRSQFNSILKSKSPEDLLADLRKKAAEK